MITYLCYVQWLYYQHFYNKSLWLIIEEEGTNKWIEMRIKDYLWSY